jgi:ribosomal protein L28
MIPPLFGKQEVGIWRVKKRFPRYGLLIWSLWPNIRFLPSMVAEKNATKNEHICSMCIKINKVGKQEVGIRSVQKRFPRYGVPIWSLWPNIRSLSSIVAEKNVTKNVHICSKCISRQTGSRNLMGPKTLPTIWGTYMKLVTKYQISVINSCWEKCDEKYLGRTEERKDGQKDGRTEVKQYTPSPFGERGEGGIIKSQCRKS